VEPATSVSDGSGMRTTAFTGDISWHPALKAAVLLGIPAGVLSSGVSSLSLFWGVAAAAWAVSLYAKRASGGWLSMGMGARIGLVTGLFASWLMVSIDGIGIWMARFVWHQGGQIDSTFSTKIEDSLKFNQQLWAGMGFASAQITQTTQFTRSWMLSPEGRAGIALAAFLETALFLVLFATIGGVVGARFLAQPRRPTA